MPDRRRHRGPHPEDLERFAAPWHDRLGSATRDLAWLLGRGYAEASALKLVGDRHGLDRRQRLAVRRASCSDLQRDDRISRRAVDIAGRTLWIDGFNVLITVEAALAGGVLLRCRDGCLRDMASLHGTYRCVEETPPAVAAVVDTLLALGAGPCRWLLDRPVSNSGRLRAHILDASSRRDLDWGVELSDDVDETLRRAPAAVAIVTADAGILDRCGSWFDLASPTMVRCATDARAILLDE